MGGLKERASIPSVCGTRLMKLYEAYAASGEGRPSGSQPARLRGFSLVGIYLNPGKVEAFFAGVLTRRGRWARRVGAYSDCTHYCGEDSPIGLPQLLSSRGTIGNEGLHKARSAHSLCH